MLAQDLTRELGTVPEYDRFATVDEVNEYLTRVAATYRGLASIDRIGTSRLGDPLLCLTVGDGDRDIVVAAGPHPNEPIGGLTVMHLATRLCEDPAVRHGARWHIVGCLDPDGTRLNEGWFAGPYTKAHYGRHFYRPAGDEQVEWTFPFTYKRSYFDRVLPETLALMRLIDRTRPAFLTTLHNGELGGVFYYLSRPEPELQTGAGRTPRALRPPPARRRTRTPRHRPARPRDLPHARAWRRPTTTSRRSARTPPRSSPAPPPTPTPPAGAPSA